MKKPVYEVISLGDELEATSTSGYDDWCTNQCEEFIYGCAFQCAQFSLSYCLASGEY